MEKDVIFNSQLPKKEIGICFKKRSFFFYCKHYDRSIECDRKTRHDVG